MKYDRTKFLREYPKVYKAFHKEGLLNSKLARTVYEQLQKLNGKSEEYTIKTPEAMRRLNISRATMWTWEKKGKFTPPRNHMGHRVFTPKQIQEIREAFSPSGSGEWHYEG